ncbi:MAG TPA: tripartite tricarboxylate transporter permease [Pseudomonas sp.]|uniref:tripartite tricarboxylate transporter permease n=1 Tax=Pseudomonas sp. TaxID=306 RepID=UPI002ED92582
MELLEHLALGFTTALTFQNLLYAFMGCLLGTLVGVLPGLGPVATIAMLLPATYALPPVSALIMLSGIYYGAQYGGSTTAILVNLPGESSSVVTTLDGYQMARRGRAGIALATAALGSFFAGTVATLLLAAFAGPLTELAMDFGPADYFALMTFGLIGAVVLASGSVYHAIGMILIGLLLGLVGTDVNSGIARFSFGQIELLDGLNFVCLAMGLFGVAEIVRNLEGREVRETFTQGLERLWPSRADFKRMWPAILRGTALGSALGVLPGGGAALASFSSYTLEKKVSRNPQEFGKGAIEGVAGPESANNAAAQTSFIPLLTLGIPSNAVMAMMIGAMVIHNIQPGPMVMTQNPDLFWGLIVSMWIGNLILLILNLPLLGIWVKLLKVPYRLMYPAILVFCAIGVFSVQNSLFDIWQMAAFGILGYVFGKLKLEPAPLLLGFVLGPMMEENLRRALLISRGDFGVFITRPISATLLCASVGLMILLLIPTLKRSRVEAFQEE